MVIIQNSNFSVYIKFYGNAVAFIYELSVAAFVLKQQDLVVVTVVVTEINPQSSQNLKYLLHGPYRTDLWIRL